MIEKTKNCRECGSFCSVCPSKVSKCLQELATRSVVAAATENNDYSKDDDPGAVIVKDVA